jgi:hypothetical protein
MATLSIAEAIRIVGKAKSKIRDIHQPLVKAKASPETDIARESST